MGWNRRAAGYGGLLLVLLAPVGVAQSGKAASKAAPEVGDKELTVGSTDGTRMEYLLGRYDKNADGVVSAGEYDRGEARFARLDSNKDGKLSDKDFESSGRGLRMDPATLAAMTVGRSFSTGEKDGMSLDALNKLLGSADADGDELLTRAEFEEHTGEGGPSSHMDAYGMLLTAIDEDGDEQLSMDEFVTWFDGRDKNEDMFLDAEELPSMGGRRGRGRGRGSSRPEPVVDPTLPNAVGQMAPDFDLKSPKGGAAVQLSSFAGDRPVALIFGSYT